MALKNNTWKVNQWYDQAVAGNVSYTTNSYQLWGWGKNSSGQIAQNSTSVTAYSSPVQVGSDTTWKHIGMEASDQYGMMAIKNDGTLWMWGQNINGALGLNSAHNTGHRSSPTQIPGTTWGDSIFSGTGLSLATKTDGTLWAWGDGNGGGLGQNEPSNSDKSSPVQIPGTDWDSTRGKVVGSMAVKTNGELWVWGTNGDGQLGQNNTTKYSSPVQIPGTTWSTLHKIAYASAAVKTDGTLWVWGRNIYGILGQNNQTAYSSPVQIPGTWKDLTGGTARNTGGFINTDNELYVMGDNEKGYLGQNDTVRYSSPVQIPGSWDQVGFAAYASMGIKTDGTAWVWGQTNEFGELGLNTNINLSSPVQLPGTGWDQPLGGMLQMFALKKQ